MVERDRGLPHPGGLAIGILLLSMSCVGTAFAGLPPGYVQGTFLYSDGIIGNGGPYTTLQAELAASEQVYDNENGFQLTYTSPQPCSQLYTGGYGPGSGPYTTIYINGVPALFCANGSGVTPWVPHTKVNVSVIVAETLVHCPVEDGNILTATYQSPGVTLDIWPAVPTVFQGQVLVNARLSGNTLYETVACKINDQMAASITAAAPVIPKGAVVDKATAHVLTHSDLTTTVTKGANPAPGVTVALQSSRPSDDTIDPRSSTTDANGIATESVQTRHNDHGAVSTITVAGTGIKTTTPAMVAWLAATYADKFLVTCYGVAQQSLDTSGPIVTIPGLKGKYHRAFYHDMRFMQGSGVLTRDPNGPYIQRDWKSKKLKFAFYPCPETENGSCATAGKSIAVDSKVIPASRKDPTLFANISISGIGDRTSADSGSMIKGHHIDVFWGRTAAAFESCEQWGRGGGYVHHVTLDSYAHY